ncbi:MAG: ribonuclease HII [Chloroflexi bacterium]|nr:ribonuclease HII [Chloroflexota bacterium]
MVRAVAQTPAIMPARRGSTPRPTWQFERLWWEEGCALVAGVDEVGRGPLAGPVVAAAVILSPPEFADDAQMTWISELRDSKRLSERHRERLAAEIRTHAISSVAAVSPQVVDQINTLQATRLAMKRAVEALPTRPAALIIDGRDVVEVDVPQRAVVGGDGRSVSVAAASILAKVTRDRLMCELDELFPGYGLAANKGYGTAAHRAALTSLGYTNIHRVSFAPVRDVMGAVPQASCGAHERWT